MKLSFETVRRLEDSGKYKMVESDGEAHLVYYPLPWRMPLVKALTL